MREIVCTNGPTILVDDEDYDKANSYTWSASSNGYTQYATHTVTDDDGTWWTLYLHRFLMEPPDGMVVDHINRNGLDCQRSNMRLATPSQSMMNRTALQGENGSGYRGVRALPTGRWRAKITSNRVEHYLGAFDTAEEAARVYDAAAKELHGEFAVLNFP